MTGASRPPCSPQELAWIENMDVVGNVRAHTVAAASLTERLRALFSGPKRFPGREQPRNALELAMWDAVADHALPYARRLPDNADAHYGKVGIAPGNAALISFTEALLIIPTADIEAIAIERITPGRSYSSGGGMVSALCRTSFGSHFIELRFGIDGIGKMVAGRLGVPLDRTEVSGD